MENVASDRSEKKSVLIFRRGCFPFAARVICSFIAHLLKITFTLLFCHLSEPFLMGPVTAAFYGLGGREVLLAATRGRLFVQLSDAHKIICLASISSVLWDEMS